jgi:hypothetical protein
VHRAACCRLTGPHTLQGLELLKDLLSIEVPLTLNEAFCDHHRMHCPKSEELDRECGKVGALHACLCAVTL